MSVRFFELPTLADAGTGSAEERFFLSDHTRRVQHPCTVRVPLFCTKVPTHQRTKGTTKAPKHMAYSLARPLRGNAPIANQSRCRAPGRETSQGLRTRQGCSPSRPEDQGSQQGKDRCSQQEKGRSPRRVSQRMAVRSPRGVPSRPSISLLSKHYAVNERRSDAVHGPHPIGLSALPPSSVSLLLSLSLPPSLPASNGTPWAAGRPATRQEALHHGAMLSKPQPKCLGYFGWVLDRTTMNPAEVQRYWESSKAGPASDGC